MIGAFYRSHKKMKNKKKHLLLMRIVFFSLIANFILSLSYEVYGHDLVWPGDKLKALYPEAVSFEQKNLYMSDKQKSHIEGILGTQLPKEDLKPSIYLAAVRKTPEERPKKVAAIIFIDTFGDGGKIEMGVVVSGQGDLIGIHIFENNESEVIRTKDFLKQFKGKTAEDAFKVGRDILSPDNYEKSAQAVASGAKRGLLIINEMFKRR